MKFLLVLLSLQAFAAEDMAKRILDLRLQVEEAGNSLEETRKKRTADLDPLLQRTSELEQAIRKERLKKVQLEEKQKLLQAKLSAKQSGASQSGLLHWASGLHQLMDAGLPFRKEERLGALASLEARIKGGRENSVTLLNDLWMLTEKEMKSSASNEYRLQPIELDGKTVQAEVARIGTVQALFRSAKGENGYAAWDGKKWSWKISAGEQASAIDRLVSRFRDKNYSGWFELPSLSKGAQL
jgi:hypothetical protein